ncbi:uracil-xanthine permease family protein [Haliangium sp.]|uniref:uracil-xanthine permease family protein n=1 Tax=Haliangium sp. TaxID=2663208 RepID=UPI003D135E9D
MDSSHSSEGPAPGDGAAEPSPEHADDAGRVRIIYDIDDMPPAREALPLGVQHVLAMFLSNIAVPLIIANAIGLAVGDRPQLVQIALVMAGLATIIQAYPLGAVGARIPMVMGTSFAFLGGIISIATQYDLETALGACLAAAVVEVVIGLAYTRVARVFPPLTAAIVVILIGLTLMPVGIDYAAGGVGAADYGASQHLAVAGLVFVVTLVLNQVCTGFLSYASIVIGAALGYAVALILGQVDFATAGASDWFRLPRLLPYGIRFELAPILLMSFIYVISALETMGDISATIAALGRMPSHREMKGGLVADGVMSGLAAVFGAFPNTSYSQNVGLIHFTGVASRHVAAIGGGILVVLGMIPKVGAAVATIPAAVIGGSGLIMFSMIFAGGVSILRHRVVLNQRNLVILAVSVGLGLGVQFRPDVLAQAPGWVKTLFGQGLVVGGLAGLVLNLVIPDRSRQPR